MVEQRLIDTDRERERGGGTCHADSMADIGTAILIADGEDTRGAGEGEPLGEEVAECSVCLCSRSGPYVGLFNHFKKKTHTHRVGLVVGSP